MLTVFTPSADDATRSPPASVTLMQTSKAAVGAGVRVTLKDAEVPSSGKINRPPASLVWPSWVCNPMDTTGSDGSFTVTSKLLAVLDGSAPSGVLVSRTGRSKPLATLPSGPSATVTVSPLPSSLASGVAVNISVAVCAPTPEKYKLGVDVVSSERITPVFRLFPVFSARLQSAVVTPAPLTDKGASTISPAVKTRLRVTVNSTVPPSVTAPVPPTRFRETTTAFVAAAGVAVALAAAPSPALFTARNSKL